MKSFLLPKTLLPALAAFLLPLSSFAATETVNGIEWTYTVTDGKATVGGGSSSSPAIPSSTSGHVTVPSALGGYPVTHFADYAFSCSGLTSISIPESVTSIGHGAFAFSSELTSATIPHSVTDIGRSIFYCCPNLAAVFIPESLVDQTGSWNLPSGCQVIVGIDVTVEDVCVPKEWIFRRASPALDAANGDWAAAARVMAANGVNKVWECDVAGLDPTNAEDRFLATISFDEAGRPLVSWTPDLGNDRDYAVKGKASLADEWGEPDADSRFFRVLVTLPPSGGDPATRTDYVYWAPIPCSGEADGVMPSVEQIKAMNKAEISDATLTNRIRLIFNGESYWKFIAFPASFANTVRWTNDAGTAEVPPSPTTTTIDGVTYNVYQWSGMNFSRTSGAIVLAKQSL